MKEKAKDSYLYLLDCSGLDVNGNNGSFAAI